MENNDSDSSDEEMYSDEDNDDIWITQEIDSDSDDDEEFDTSEPPCASQTVYTRSGT